MLVREMKCAQLVCVLLVALVFVTCVDCKKSFSSRRKSGSSRRGSSTSSHQKPSQQVPGTPHRSDSTNTHFLSAERAGSSHSTGPVNTHIRNPFNNKPPSVDTPRQSVPHTNGPIGFEGLNNQGNQKIGFEKIQNKPSSNVPSAPAYPGSPAKPASPPGGAPPPYPGYGSPGTGAHAAGSDYPPAYPGRPINAPPVYSANNPNYHNNPNHPGSGGFNNNQGGFQHNSYQQSAYPQQTGGYSAPSYPGQQGFGYSHSGGNVGNYHNQGYNQGFSNSYPNGGYGNSFSGGLGQSHSGFGGNPYGGSPFGQSQSFGGNPFTSGGFGNNGFGSYSNNHHYSPNNFGFSSNPGLFGSFGNSGKYNNFGYHKKSRFGGLPIPIPIPIPIPLGGFGGFGGHSYNHRLLDTFVKNKNITTSDNETTAVFILNNSTVTPCTTDQFIYDSLNVTVTTCTAGNCTAVKVFVTTYVSNNSATHSASITLCLEPNATFSSHADNVLPSISEVHNYWMRVCKDIITANTTKNGSDVVHFNITTKISETPLTNSINISDVNTTANGPPESETVQNIEVTVNETVNTDTLNNFNINSTTLINTSLCEIFNCSWMEMCLPTVEVVDRCGVPNCPFTRTGYKPCITLKMCKSPNTPISTFATFNATISRTDEFNNITTVNDIANLTMISYIPSTYPVNCSEYNTDPLCHPPLPSRSPLPLCPSTNSSEFKSGELFVSGNATLCDTPVITNSKNFFEENTKLNNDESTTMHTP